jgi:hypothetical protein
MKTFGKRFIFILTFLALVSIAHAQTPREQLNQMAQQLQKTPSDNALREKIIKLARTLKPSPALPDTAVAFEGRAQFAFRSAKSEDDFLAAAREYEKAVAAAPWVPGYYADLCTIYEKAGKFEDAKRHCGFYLIGITDPAQMTDVKRRIAGLEFGIEKVATEKRRVAEEANSPRGRATAMLALLRKQYAGPVRKLLICGVLSNKYWQCTDEEARGSNWVDSVSVDAYPKPGVGPVEYKIVGTESDVIKVSLGTYSWPNGSLVDGGFRGGCAKPNGVDPNSMIWVRCPGWDNAGHSLNVTVLFTPTNADGSPVIEYRDSCGDTHACRRAQFILQP